MTRQQRVFVFLVALAALAGLGTLAFFMFLESPSPGIVPDRVADHAHEKDAAQTPAPAPPSARPAPLGSPEPGSIKPKAFVDLDLTPVSGFVRDERDLPVEGALCELFEDASAMRDTVQEGELRGSQRTEASGAFLFERTALPPVDDFMIKVHHASFATARKAVDVRALSAGGIVIVLKAGTQVSGMIRGGGGEPVPAATVTVYGANQGSVDPGGAVETVAAADSSGAWVAAHVTAGVKRILASAPGYATSGRLTVEVVAGVPLAGLDIELRRGGVISGRASATDGSPVEGAYVSAQPTRIKVPAGPEQPREPDAGGEREKDGEAERQKEPEKGRELTRAKPDPARIQTAPPTLVTLSARTGPDGAYTIQGAEVGSYVVTIAAPGYAPPGAIAVESPAQGVDFTLTPGARILGQVVDADTGQPVPRFKIGIAASADEAIILPFTKRAFGPPRFQEGRFELREFGSPGRFWLVAEAPGYAGGRSEEIVIGQGERREGVVIRLVRGATIRGRVIDGRGEPVADASVSLESGSALANSPANIFLGPMMRRVKRDPSGARTDREGRFAIQSVLPGSYAIAARHDQFGPHTTQSFSIAGSGETVVPDIVLARGATIRGRVRLKDGQPDAEALVQVALADGGTAGMQSQRTANTDAEGRFEIAGLAVGRYRITVVQRAGKADLAVLFQQAGLVVALSEGEEKDLDL